jgi:hypothetical protein
MQKVLEKGLFVLYGETGSPGNKTTIYLNKP